MIYLKLPYLMPNIFYRSVLMGELEDLEAYLVAERSFPCFCIVLLTKLNSHM